MSAPDSDFLPGYHMRPITKGRLGALSKIREELDELEDAEQQGVAIMALVELADLYGAVEAYINQHHPGITMADLADMAHVTARAFRNGRRVSSDPHPPSDD